MRLFLPLILSLAASLLPTQLSVGAESKDAQGRTPLHLAAGKGDAEQVRQLLAAGTDVNARDDSEETPLHQAARAGSKEAAALLIAAGADVNAKGDVGQTPLHLSAEAGHADVVELLLQKGANREAKNFRRFTALELAERNQHPDVVKLLGGQPKSPTVFDEMEAGNRDRVIQMVQADPSLVKAADGKGRFLIHLAVARGDVALIKLLLDKGASADAISSESTPLCTAIAGGWKEVVALLLERGANPNLMVGDVFPLYYACRGSQTDLVEMLLAKGASPDLQLGSGDTCLHLAAETGKLKLAQLLLTHRANLNARNQMNRTPLQLAAGRGYDEVVQLLLDSGAEPALPDSQGRDALAWAVAAGHVSVVELLLESGAPIKPFHFLHTDISYEDARAGRDEALLLMAQVISPKSLAPQETFEILSWTVQQRRKSVLKELVKQGLDLNVRTEKDDSLLAAAVQSGDKDGVQLLLSCGARPDVQDKTGFTPLHYAVNPRKTEIAHLLLLSEHGKDISKAALNEALGLAVKQGQTDLVGWLLDAGADVNARIDRNWNTPLISAASRGQKDMVVLLLSKGAQANLPNDAGRTALMVAKSDEIKDILAKAGATIRLNPPERP